MIVLVEGTEATGKTTLAKELAVKMGYDYVHMPRPTNTTEEEKQLQFYNEIAVAINVDIVLDRCWYSEIVYGTVIRGKSGITFSEMWYFEKGIANNCGGLIIHCTDPVDVLWARMQKRGDDYIKHKEDLADLKGAYERVMHETRHYLPIVRYELTKNLSRM